MSDEKLNQIKDLINAIHTDTLLLAVEVKHINAALQKNDAKVQDIADKLDAITLKCSGCNYPTEQSTKRHGVEKFKWLVLLAVVTALVSGGGVAFTSLAKTAVDTAITLGP